MRRLSRLLVASLILNLLLGIVYCLAVARAPKPVPLSTRPTAPPSTQAPSTLVTTLAIVPSPKPLDWRSVESDDYKQYVANLRAAGCPEKTVRDVIIADINELYRERFRAVFPTTNRVEYWKTGNPMADFIDETRIAKEHELCKEKRELVKLLLGSDYSDEDDLSAIRLDSNTERLLDFLALEKRTAMKELEDRFSVELMKTYKDTWRGNDGPAAAVRAENEQAILKVLSPEEKFEYDLRRSDAAMFLRVGLGGVEVSEQEFRSLYPGIKSFIDEAGGQGFGAMMLGHPDSGPVEGAARLALRRKLEALLGSDRARQIIEETGWNLDAEVPQ